MRRTLITEKKRLSGISNQTVKLLFTFLLLISMSGYGQIKLPRLIQDGMILQRDVPVKSMA